MFRKNKFLLAMLVSSTVVPYVMSTTNGAKKVIAYFQTSAKSEKTTTDESAADVTTTSIAAGTTAGKPHSAGATVKPAPIVHPIEDALRFDITTAWVLGNWPRVSANLAELDLQGYRVPLVSGTTDVDVAGSLTYYFNPKQRLERITFFGTTGDARKLVALLESRFEFKRAESKEPNLYLYQVKSWRWGKVTSELRIRPASVIRNEAPNSRFEVALLIDRPKSMD